MKKNLVDMLLENGFTEQPFTSEILDDCHGLILQREWTTEVDVAFSGKVTLTYKVRVFINRNSEICHVAYFRGSKAPYKTRWYDTIGKRTYNAIVETTRCAGFEF